MRQGIRDSDTAATPSAERSIYRDYEQSRRLRLAITLLPIFAIIQFGVFLVSILLVLRVHYASPYEQLFIANTALVGLDALLHAVGIRFARRGEVNPATLLVVLPTGLTLLLPSLSYSVAIHFAPVVTSPLVPISLGVIVATTLLIILSGLVFANRFALVFTTVLLNCFTLYLMATVISAPGIGAAVTTGALLLLAFPVFVQWAAAGILYATTETSVQTLKELGDIRIAYERAQQLDQLKDQFIAHINHELRSPVMALLGHVELLLLTDETLTGEERHNYLVRAKRSGDQLANLVNSILAARGLEQENPHAPAEAIDLRDALASSLDLIDPREGKNVERELRLDIPAGLAVWGSPTRFRQICTNLISNATKYSEPGTPINIRARVLEKSEWATRGPGTAEMPSSTTVEITVRDFGLGIPPEQIPLLFNRFVRLPRDLASSVPGNGLGLYLCRAYAQEMGGKMWVESAGVPGEGTSVHLLLPEAPASPAELAAESSVASNPVSSPSD